MGTSMRYTGVYYTGISYICLLYVQIKSVIQDHTKGPNSTYNSWDNYAVNCTVFRGSREGGHYQINYGGA